MNSGGSLEIRGFCLFTQVAHRRGPSASDAITTLAIVSVVWVKGGTTCSCSSSSGTECQTALHHQKLSYHLSSHKRASCHCVISFFFLELREALLTLGLRLIWSLYEEASRTMEMLVFTYQIKSCYLRQSGGAWKHGSEWSCFYFSILLSVVTFSDIYWLMLQPTGQNLWMQNLLKCLICFHRISFCMEKLFIYLHAVLLLFFCRCSAGAVLQAGLRSGVSIRLNPPHPPRQLWLKKNLLKRTSRPPNHPPPLLCPHLVMAQLPALSTAHPNPGNPSIQPVLQLLPTPPHSLQQICWRNPVNVSWLPLTIVTFFVC